MQENNKQQIAAFALASFLNDIGSNISDTIFPFFVTEFLKCDMGILGIINGIEDFFYSFSQFISGFISDRIKKRKPFIVLGYSFCGFSKIGYAISSIWQHALAFAILDRSGKIRDPPRDAIVAEISKAKSRGRNFGIIKAMDNLGAVVGIILCYFLINYLDYNKIFLIAAIPSLIASFVILVFIKEKRIEKKENKKEKEREKKRKIKLNKNVKILLLASAIFNLGFFGYSFFLIYAKSFFEKSFIPFLFLTYSLVASLSSVPFGKLSDRIGRKKILGIAYLLWLISCFFFIFANSAFEIFLLFIIYGFVLGAKKPIEPTFVSELQPEEKASVLGIFRGINGFCVLLASIIAGFLWDAFGKKAIFSFSIPLTILSLFILSFTKETLKNKK
ncbi:MAG: MFS transporter [Candidatus Micrarchaeia archaeon]